MPDVKEVPQIGESPDSVGPCRLTVTPRGEASTPADAWALLPSKGTGIVTLSDRVVRFDAHDRAGLIIDADVVDGDTTTILRMSGNTWRAWEWKEEPGTTHRRLQLTYQSTETISSTPAPALRYRQYWELQPDEGIEVWQPVGSRFCGFKEEVR